MLDGSCEKLHTFKKLPPERRRQIRLLCGHMPFGLHKYLPCPADYITILRDPVDRVVSHYFYSRRKTTHYLHEQVEKGKLSLGEYISQQVATELDNGQVRLLSGVEKSVPFGKVTREMLEQAKENLMCHFKVIGLTERFDESMMLLRKDFPWVGWPFYSATNVTKKRLRLTEIPSEELDIVRGVNRLDSELYDFVHKHFEAEVQDIQSYMKKSLKFFQRWNRVYQKAMTPTLKARSIFIKWIKGAT